MKNISNFNVMGYGSPVAGRVASVTAALVLISASAFGAAIGTGQDNTAGTVLVDSSGIFFSNFVTPGPDTGSYAGNTTVTQGSLSGTPTLSPNLTDWAEFAGTASGLIKFDLSTLTAGIGTIGGCSSDAVGSVCTPAGSPITLTQYAGSVSMFLSGSGIAYTGTSGTGSTPTVVSFTSQNNVPGTITEILAAVSNGGFTNSVSATYSSSPVPEPMTLSMMGMGLGLVGLGLFARRRQN